MRVLAVARGRRCYSTSATALPLLSVSKAEIFKFGDGPPKPPLFGALEWTVHEHEAWAVVGRGSARKTQLLEVSADPTCHICG
jgi:ABC-type molybdenum transport system ATPase subunit/photorepair protein PhrA